MVRGLVLTVQLACLLCSQFVAAGVSKVCPSVAQNSLNQCARCVADDLCPIVNGVNWKCHPTLRKCVDPAWNGTQALAGCPSSLIDPSTWDAMCKMPCTDSAPFGCAVNYCMNRDYPCDWVPNCQPPFAVQPISITCLQDCVDRPDVLQSLYGYTSCAQAIAQVGCQASFLGLSDFCPVSCGGPLSLCATRCGASEQPASNGYQCWQFVEQTGATCVQAIKLGMDCHCKCGSTYFLAASQTTHTPGTPFTPRDYVAIGSGTQGAFLGLNLSYTAGQNFNIDVTGEGLSTDTSSPAGSRIKVVSKGDPCASSSMPTTLKGLSCTPPSPTALLQVTSCDTKPSVATQWYQRWSAISLQECGDFEICHCSRFCDSPLNWKRLGSLALRPVFVFGSATKILPNCSRYLPQLEVQGGIDEVKQPQMVTVWLSFTGGLIGVDRTMTGIQQALATYLGVPSSVLGMTAPQASDITVVNVDLQTSGKRRLSSRRTGTCADMDLSFSKEVGGQFSSCSQAVGFMGATTLCTYDMYKTAVTKYCQLTCGLCSNAPSTTAAPDPLASNANIVWPGGSSAIRTKVSIQTATNLVMNNTLGRLLQLKKDPSTFLQALFPALSDAGLLSSEIPSSLWVYIAAGPVVSSVPTQAPERTALSTSSIITIAVGVAGGVSVLLGVLGVACWCCFKREAATVTVQEGRPEEVKVSEGGYRLKKIAGQEAKVTVDLPKDTSTLFERSIRCCCACAGRIHQRFFAKELTKVTFPANPQATGLGLRVGCRVKLTGLSQAHFNGLTGTVTEGPNDKGRYMVDVQLTDSELGVEIKPLSFKAENLQMLAWDDGMAGTPGAVPLAAKATDNGGSYRKK